MVNSVSVVIPVGRWEWYVDRAVRSALDQGACVGEIILVDNSLDCSSAPQFDSDIVTVLRSDVALDAARARNIGVNFSSCEYIAVLDSDDEYVEEHLNVAINALDKSPEAFLYYCSYVNLDSSGNEEYVKAVPIVGVRDVVVNCTIGHSSVVFRRNDCFIYPEIGRRHDYAAWLNLLSDGRLFISNERVGMIRHRQKNSLSSGSLVSLFFKQAKVTYCYSRLSWVDSSYLLFKFLMRAVRRKIS